MDHSTPNLKELPKDELIEHAYKMLASKYPDFTFDVKDYEITAWANTEKVVVLFRRIIRFTPLDRKDEDLSFDFELDLTHQRILPFDTWGMKRFYIPTKDEQKKIDFVVNSFGMPRLGFNNSIVEDTAMYKIQIDNEVAFGHYFIDKITGEECIGSIEGSYAPMPDDIPELIDPDPLVEIKE
ncbi:MAG: hypothetical protein R8N23_13440 [Reichenbachiella sp.]|uniref:hypothetical protein n=1 Tax=Reichenbachiella sp. TaxID=2184521 RepID=UPI002965FDC4|nr:hypothetical protein [Reichenbachiella sp.]MDW3210874.1 hypothetical protein [Reichenbachiella sp.]